MSETDKQVCPACGSENAADHKHCSQCGAPLGSMAVTDADQIRKIIQSELKDRDVLEVTLAAAAAERLKGWVTTFGYFAALPLFLLFLTLTIWGITKFADFESKFGQAQAKIDATQKDVLDKLTSAQDKAKSLASQSTDLQAQYQRLSEDAQKYQRLGSEVASLRTDLSKVQERVGLTKTSAITGAQQRVILSQLPRFQRYFADLGYSPKPGIVNVDVRDEADMPGAIAYFDLDKRTAVVSRNYVSDISVILREYSHSVLYSNGPPRDEAPANFEVSPFYTAEYALASYFPASFLNSPNVTMWHLDQPKKWVPNGRIYDNDEALAGAFWEVRQKVSDRHAYDRALLQAWLKTVGQRNDANFLSLLLQRVADALGSDGAVVRTAFKSHGIPM